MSFRRIILGEVHLGPNAAYALIYQPGIEPELRRQALMYSNLGYRKSRQVSVTNAYEIVVISCVCLQFPPTWQLQAFAQVGNRSLHYGLGNAKLAGDPGANPVKLDRLCQFLIASFDTDSQLFAQYEDRCLRAR